MLHCHDSKHLKLPAPHNDSSCVASSVDRCRLLDAACSQWFDPQVNLGHGRWLDGKTAAIGDNIEYRVKIIIIMIIITIIKYNV